MRPSRKTAPPRVSGDSLGRRSVLRLGMVRRKAGEEAAEAAEGEGVSLGLGLGLEGKARRRGEEGRVLRPLEPPAKGGRKGKVKEGEDRRPVVKGRDRPKVKVRDRERRVEGADAEEVLRGHPPGVARSWRTGAWRSVTILLVLDR